MHDSSDDFPVDFALFVGALVFAFCVYLGFGPWSSSWVNHRHAEFSPSVATVIHKSNLVGGGEEHPDHYRVAVLFSSTIGKTIQREIPVSYKLKNKRYVLVYLGPGNTFDIPADFEGAHPRNPSLFIPKAVGVVGGICLGFIFFLLGMAAPEMMDSLRNRGKQPKHKDSSSIDTTGPDMEAGLH
jgi:hypothetical protein